MSIIALAGRMGSGKNTVGDIIEKLCLTNNGPKFEQKAFAGKLKQIASLLTGIPVEDFEDQEFKKTNLGQEWARPFYDKNSNVHYETITVRKFLQLLGTESMRIGLHTNVWVNALFADYKGPKLSEYDPSNWIITDVRFPNELEAIVERKGITIRVHRDIHDGKARISKNPHVSETAIDDAKFDYEIMNDGSIEDLIKKVRIILITEKII